MSNVAVVLTCDNEYVVPTISTAISARRNITALTVQVIVYVIGDEPGWANVLRLRLLSEGILISWVSLDGFEDLSLHHSDRYLPPIVLARFWLDSLLPAEIESFLYLDGDIMVNKSLDELLRTTPPPSGVMACADNLHMFSGEKSRGGGRDRAYLAGLGINDGTYFNSGVILCSRDAWRELVPTAIDFMRTHPELCRSSDQSALNFATRGGVVLLPQEYNYQSEHMMILDPRDSFGGAAIYHFTGAPKPWTSATWPWDEYFNRYYREAVKLCAGLAVADARAPEAQEAAGRAHRRRYRFRTTYVYPWRRISRKSRLNSLMSRENNLGLDLLT